MESQSDVSPIDADTTPVDADTSPVEVDTTPVEVDCEFSPFEQEIADSLTEHPDQQRPTLTCNPILTDVAQARALDMATRDYFGHVNPDGLGPNALVMQAGYTLPEDYNRSLDANKIESIAAGSTTPTETWSLLIQSEPHRNHLLAEQPAFASQTVYGVGHVHVSDSEYKNYWVIITAPAQ